MSVPAQHAPTNVMIPPPVDSYNSAAEQIKARLALEDVIGETVALKPAGRGRLKGLCPFHTEKTPSFSVNTERGFYYCFGCSAKGDLFSFVMQTQGLSFPEALELLAPRAGVTLSEKSERPRPSRDLYDALTAAQTFFEHSYNSSVRVYLNGRGLTDETIAKWGLGFAPDAWTSLRDALTKQGYSAELLERAGLVKRKDDGRTYDVFRNRVTIPIHDTFGRVVGFTGRSLEQDPQAKYLNTPETEVFKKGELLFGYNHARETAKKSHAAIAVEGHLDVIMLHQHGFSATVGVQGAALTEGQIALLERQGCHALYMALDGDEAGQKATLAACETVARRMVVKVAVMPEGCKDPTDVLTSGGDFQAVLDNAVSEESYVFGALSQGVDYTTKLGRPDLLKRLKPHLIDKETPGDGHDLRALVSTKLPGMKPDDLKAWATGKNNANFEQYVDAQEEREAEKGLFRERLVAEDAAFPVWVYPEAMQNLVGAAADALPAPPDFIGVPMLAALAAAIGNSRVLEVKPGYTVFPSIYATIIGDPGSKKSPALSIAGEPLEALQSAYKRQYDDAKAEHKELQTYYDANVKAGDRNAAPPDPLEPMRQCKTTEATAEAFISLHAKNLRGMTLWSDELSGFVAGMNQYKGGKGNDRQHWLSMWSAVQILLNRKGKEAEVLNAPRVNIIGSIQPDILPTLQSPIGEDGFIDRFLFAYPKSVRNTYTDASISQKLQEDYRSLFFKLTKLQTDNEGKPKVLRMTPAAQKLWRTWANSHAGEEYEPGFDLRLRGAWAKLESYCARFALILHLAAVVAGDEASESISADSLSKAITLTDYFKAQARRVYKHLHAQPTDKALVAILKYLERQPNGRCNTRALLKAGLPGCKTKKDLEAKLKALEAADLGRSEVVKLSSGQKSSFFMLTRPD